MQGAALEKAYKELVSKVFEDENLEVLIANSIWAKE